MTRTTILAMLLLPLAGCGSGPPTGQCTGQIGAIPINGGIDASSEVHRRYPVGAVCGVTPPAVYSWSYGGGALRIAGGSTEAVSILTGEKTYPLPPSSEATFMTTWNVLSPSPHPDLLSGDVTLKFKIGGRHEGKLRMDFVDGSAVSCTFDLPHGSDEGTRPSCPDDDHDDWD